MDTEHPEKKTFEAPRHWVGVEELSAEYWNDPKIQERRAQEFYDKPIETIAQIDLTDQAGLARREFLTIMGASVAMSTLACARRPVHKIIPYVVKPDAIIPGVADFYASTDPESGAGVIVKTREARPIKLEGNPEHPLSLGTMDARGQGSLLNLYDPDRLQFPMMAGEKTTWADADASVIAKLKKLAAGSGRVRVLTGDVLSPTTRRLIEEFLGAFHNGVHVEYEALALDEICDAQAECYGASLTPNYRFDQADLVVSVGADFLGTWPHANRHSRDWARKRKLNGPNNREAAISKLVSFESVMSLTGANSDERYPIRPGDELKILLALARELSTSSSALSPGVRGILDSYKLEAVASETGVPAEKLKALAQHLQESRGKSLVVAGAVHSKTEDALAVQIAVNWLNSTLGNEGSTVDGGASSMLNRASSFASINKLIQEMGAGQVDALIVWGANPAYTLPKAAGFSQAVGKVSLVISAADRVNETAQAAQYVLPNHHWLENWGDARPSKSLYSIQQPVISPLYDTRAFQDTLLAWIKGAGLKPSALATKSTNWHDYLKGAWTEIASREWGVSGAGFERFWEKTLKEGVVDSLKGKQPSSSPRAFKSSALARLPRRKTSTQDLTLVLYAKAQFGDGRHANNAWLQELPDSVSTNTWDNYLNVGPALARKLSLDQDDVVEVTTELGSVELPVNVQPGMGPNVVSAAVGYGRRAVGKVGDGTGVDVFPLAKIAGGSIVFAGLPVKVRGTGKFYKIAQTQWHNAKSGLPTTMNRPIINDVTLAEYRENAEAENETKPELRLKEIPSMWSVHDYSKGYQWGMAIDLNSCTGCGACVIACQAENNIPVVGRGNVRNSREMHWIRIDRYYSGSEESPRVVFQPMLCQHCENAPCETVCPVLATVHSSEGLNEQVYNRCVGTRYCQNNCPYKTRRFNFFDHWKSYEGAMNMAWNPEVTVRTRGIMEKCTFCVQRIQDSRNKAVLGGKHIQDGDLKTACQQTCPTEAISFGNINDAYSQVAKQRTHKRAFRVLEALNTKPRISYLTKVRNIAAERTEGHSEGHEG